MHLGASTFLGHYLHQFFAVVLIMHFSVAFWDKFADLIHILVGILGIKTCFGKSTKKLPKSLSRIIKYGLKNSLKFFFKTKYNQ